MQGSGMLRLDEIIGLEVLSSDAKVLGNVEAIGVNTEDWHAHSLRIVVRKGMEEALGLKKPVFGGARTALGTDKVQSVRDYVKLNEPLQKLRSSLRDPNTIPFNAGDIINKRVVCEKGREIGITGSLYFDTEGGWRIPYIEVEAYRDVFKEMDLKKVKLKRKEVKVPTSLVSTVGDLVMLNTSEDELTRILEHTPR